MHDLLIASLFLGMLILPCLTALRTRAHEDAA